MFAPEEYMCAPELQVCAPLAVLGRLAWWIRRVEEGDMRVDLRRRLGTCDALIVALAAWCRCSVTPQSCSLPLSAALPLAPGLLQRLP